MKRRYDIHPDFAKISVSFPGMNRLVFFLLNQLNKLLCRRHPPKADVQQVNESLVGPDGNRIPVIIYKPRNPQPNLPALIYYHGGAFVLTYAHTQLRNAAEYAERANCCVVFVDYRLAPKYPFPAGFDDCYSALQWTQQNADSLGIDKTRVAVGGDSAGGALAAGVAQKALQEDQISLCGQLLIYPVTDKNCKTDSIRNFPDTPIWNGRTTVKMWQLYVQQPQTADFPDYASPMQGELVGQPSAYVEVAEFDPLRDEGKDYAQALKAAGTTVEFHDTKRTIHAYDSVFGSAITQDSLQRRIGFLQRVFSQG